MAAEGTIGRDSVVLQLRWDHEFQFAGYYAANWLGHYDRAGIDVDIRSGVSPDRSFVSAPAEVAEGRAQFGVGGAEVLQAIDAGADILVLATYFQQSGNALYALESTPLREPSDFTRLRVSRKVGDMVDAELLTLLRVKNIDSKLVPPHPYRFGLDELVDGKVDVIPGRSLSVPWLAHVQNVRLRALWPSDYGIDFYGDSLFTSAGLAEENPDLVNRFTRASTRGWKYALDNPDEIARRIADELPRNFKLEDPLAYNLFEAREVRKLMRYPEVEIGATDPKRWRRMYTLLHDVSMVSGGRDSARFVHLPDLTLPEPGGNDKHVVLTAILLLVMGFFLAWRYRQRP